VCGIGDAGQGAVGAARLLLINMPFVDCGPPVLRCVVSPAFHRKLTLTPWRPDFD